MWTGWYDFLDRLRVATNNLQKETIDFTDTADEIYTMKVLKCKEKDLVYNLSICQNNEMGYAVSSVFAKGRWFYIPFYAKGSIFRLGLRGEWLW